MNAKLAEILLLLLQHLLSGNSELIDTESVADELLRRGFEHDDVRQAMEWLAEQMGVQGPAYQGEAVHPNSRRILHEVEHNFLSPEAKGFLAELQNSSLLNTAETEAYIARAMWSERSEVPFEELREFVSTYMLGQERLDISQQQWLVRPAHPSRH